MTLYHVSIKCSHCKQLTFIEEMDTGRFERTVTLLKPVLHSFVCRHCQKAFGTNGTLVREQAEPRG